MIVVLLQLLRQLLCKFCLRRQLRGTGVANGVKFTIKTLSVTEKSETIGSQPSQSNFQLCWLKYIVGLLLLLMHILALKQLLLHFSFFIHHKLWNYLFRSNN